MTARDAALSVLTEENKLDACMTGVSMTGVSMTRVSTMGVSMACA